MTLSLPDSAKDLLIEDGKLLMQSLSVYEILRRFRHILRLSPFRFEDFCAALLAEEQSILLTEVHLQLLKTLIREDRLQQTWLGPPDIRDSFNLYLHSVDHTNWPSVLKLYLSADPNENSNLLATLKENNDYPFNVDLNVRLDTLSELCDKFLLSNLARDAIVTTGGGTGYLKHDTICRLCSKTGDLVFCDTCAASYHLKCSDPPLDNFPKEDEPYLCTFCKLNRVKGVTDCIDTEESGGNLKRLEALGEDLCNHRYWFLIRRVFVIDEDEEDVRYYTNIGQLNDLLASLNEDNCDKSLMDNILRSCDEIERQMQITEELYKSQLVNFKLEAGGYSKKLGQEGSHRNYINHYATSNLALSKNQPSDRDTNRSLNNKFSINSLNSFKWFGAINGQQALLMITVKTTIIKFEAMIPSTFIHPCWPSLRSIWVKSINQTKEPLQLALALSYLETAIKPVLYKAAWHDAIGFCQLFRSTLLEREETKKTDRLQPRGFERRESYSAEFELSLKLGTMVKFSSKLKPVKHQVWKQKGEEYRLTGINGWSWQSKCYKSRPVVPLKPSADAYTFNPAKKSLFVKPKLPPCHTFQTKRDKVRSLLILPKLELKKLARSGGLKEAKSFSYTAKQSKEVWPYGMTPRPTFRTCWLYRNRLVQTLQDASLQLKVLYACIRWDELQARPPASGQNVIVTDENTVTIELLKKRDRLPFLTHSEYLIKKVSTPIEEQSNKYRKISTPRKQSTTPSARSGLRARRQTMEEEVKGPTTEEIWVPEDQLELWELKQFDEKIERQNQLMRERILREAAEKKRKLEEERRMKMEQERRQRLEQEAQKARLAQAAAKTASVTAPTMPVALAPGVTPLSATNHTQLRPTAPSTPVIRYFRTEQGQIIRLPASYLERGTPLILRHVGPGPGQTNTYIIRPQMTLQTQNQNQSQVQTQPQAPQAKQDEPEKPKCEVQIEPEPEAEQQQPQQQQQPHHEPQQAQPEIQQEKQAEPVVKQEQQQQQQHQETDQSEGNRQEESASVTQESVGTAVNETAHDQREPSST